MRELIKKRGFRLGAVAEAIGVSYETLRTWSNTAPIDKLIKISEFCDINIIEIVDCFRSDRSTPTQTEIEDN